MSAAISDWWYHRGLSPGHRDRIAAARLHLKRLKPLAVGNDQQRAEVFGRLRSMNPYVFEELVLECLKRRGNRIRRNLRYSNDGGMDGRIWHRGCWCPVQVKRYSSAIDPAHVMELGRLMAEMGAPAGWFVHTGRTGPASRVQAEAGGEIRMISGGTLLAMIAGA